jgi:hypothetical protein
MAEQSGSQLVVAVIVIKAAAATSAAGPMYGLTGRLPNELIG